MSRTVLRFDNIEKIQPLCPHFVECGGCAYQDIPYIEQLKVKEEYMKNLLMKNGFSVDVYEGIKPSPEAYGYKNKMEFSFGDYKKGGELALGLHRKGRFMDILSTECCKIVDDDFNAIVKSTQEYFRKSRLPHYNRKTHNGYQRFLIVRKGKNTGEILINLVTTSQVEFDLTGYVEEIKRLRLRGTLTGILHTVDDSPSDAIKPEKIETLFGRDYIYEKIFNLMFKISPFSFFQTNTKGAEILYGKVREYAGDIKGRKILDLYCGTGTIGITLARDAKEVLGIELVDEAVQAARENARLNNIDNCQFFVGDASEALSSIGMRPDIVIVDPPRPGIGAKTARDIIGLAPNVIVYVSCNPLSLMEDLKIWNNDYSIKRIINVDMFPHTAHVECVTLMSRVKK